MGLFQRRSGEYATKVRKDAHGWSFELSPGVTITVHPNDPELEWFAERLARLIQRVTEEEWT